MGKRGGSIFLAGFLADFVVVFFAGIDLPSLSLKRLGGRRHILRLSPRAP
jgi:hypothetical protein